MAFLLRNYTKESQAHFALAQAAKHYKLGGLTTTEIYSLQLQRLEAHEQDASTIRSW